MTHPIYALVVDWDAMAGTSDGYKMVETYETKLEAMNMAKLYSLGVSEREVRGATLLS